MSTLTSRNKEQLPKNSYPALGTSENRPEVDKKNTKKRFSTMKVNQQHEGKKTCPAGIEWDNFVAIATTPHHHSRACAIREALEIQREEGGNS